jgi:nitrogen fixation protein
MREVPIKFAFAFLALIMLTTPSFLSYSVSAEDEVDNWPESDAWLHIELVSWSANQTVEWDNDDGPPDPHFQICIEADGDNIDCINTQTWENQLTLNNSWNYSIDIPDYSNILNITIECKDNDAINDDECDMNSELDEWKLYAQYNWSANPTLTVIGNGSGDGDETWKNAASEWRFTIGGYGDEDFDGVEDSIDNCPSTSLGSAVDSNGCDATQRDSDNDGVSDAQDNWPEEDAWLYINLISWSANQTVEWDNNEGFPDPHFQICIEADGDNIDCINTPTWDDQLTLNNPWNYPIDLPDYSNILNITIECGDNDALNDDECDMNSELEEWKLYAQYNWSQTPTLTLIGNGDGDGYGTWKNAASEWRLTIGGYVDEDFDGVEDSIDNCPSTDIQYTVDEHGCSLSQKDSDNDGVTDADDNCPATNLGSTVDSDGCDATQRDSDFDGIVDSKDECSNTPNGIAVDENGCDFREGSDSSTNSDDSREGSSDSSSGFSSGIFCSLLIIGIVVVVIRLGAKNKPGQHRVHTPPSRQQHIPIQRQPSQQEIQAQMLHQKQIEAQHLQNQLAQQASQTQYLQQQLAKQSRSASEMKGMQEELAQLQESKAALEQELEETSKATTVVQNITYNIQDSAISGDLNANLNPKEE